MRRYVAGSGRLARRSFRLFLQCITHRVAVTTLLMGIEPSRQVGQPSTDMRLQGESRYPPGLQESR